MPAEPRYTVKQRVDITLSAAEIEHALRCWLLEKAVPQPESFSDVFVRVYADDDGNALSASLIYAPETAA